MMTNRATKLMILLALATVFGGCATDRISLVDQGRVSIEEQANERVDILWPNVYREDGRVWAYGALKQRGYRCQTIRRHVDIEVLGEDGSVQFRAFSKDVTIPPNRLRRGPNWTRFRVELPDTDLSGSRIVMTVHTGEHVQG